MFSQLLQFLMLVLYCFLDEIPRIPLIKQLILPVGKKFEDAKKA